MDKFRAYRIDEQDGKIVAGFQDLSVEDLTEGNVNGKNSSIEAFLFTETVTPNIPAKEEYLKYRQALKNLIVDREELRGIDIKQILHAREEGIALLKANIQF